MKYKDIKFIEYKIVLKNVAIIGDIKITSRAEYLEDDMLMAMDMLSRYGSLNSSLNITMAERGFTDEEITVLEKRDFIPDENGGNNPF